MHHLIIGTGPAGVLAADTLRALDADAAIVLLGDEPGQPYARMAIPYLLNGRIGEQGTLLRKDNDHFDARGIELHHGRVQRIDPDMHSVTLDNGSTRSYDRLLIATGSHPVSPPIAGIDLPLVRSCWTLDDARRIAADARPGARAVLMGAGFIGCIILEALVSRGVELTVVEAGDRMVPRMMNDKAGGLIERWCADQGVQVITGTRVAGIGASGVTLSSGQQLAADLVISATGVAPNIGLLDGSGIQVDHGILVDTHMATSAVDVFAAGDVAQARDFSTGEQQVQAIQPTATDHGRIAAFNMAGRPLEHGGSVNMNVLDTLGLVSSSFGLWMGVEGGEQAELHDPRRFRYLNLQFADDLLVGASAVGLTQHVGVLRGLIQGRIRLGEWKQRLIDDPTRIMEAWLACAGPISSGGNPLRR